MYANKGTMAIKHQSNCRNYYQQTVKMNTIKYQNVDEYIVHFPTNIQQVLQQLRAIIKNTAPSSEELISYNMPAYKQNGVLVYFAAHKKHIGFYPTALPIKVFEKELTTYKCSKGAIQLPIDKPLPSELIAKIVKFKIEENAQKVKSKKI